MKIVVTTALLLLAQIATADVTGRWAGQANMMGQMIPVLYTFQADGETLTGTAPAGPEQTVPLNGTIKGDKIQFLYETEFMKRKMRVQYKGVVKGNEMELTQKGNSSQGLTGRIAAPQPKLILNRVR